MDKKVLDSMDLDEDVRDVVELLNDNGFTTLASCDGVLAHHLNNDWTSLDGYVYLEQNEKLPELIAYAYERGMNFNFSNKLDKDGHLMGSHLTYGGGASIRFFNSDAENSQNLKDIVHEFINEGKRASNDTLSIIKDLDSALNDNDSDDSYLHFTFFCGCFPYKTSMKKEGTTNKLMIVAKDHADMKFDPEFLGHFIEDNLGIPYKRHADDETFEEDTFSITLFGKTFMVYFKENDYKKLLEIPKLLRDNEDKLKRIPKAQ